MQGCGSRRRRSRPRVRSLPRVVPGAASVPVHLTTGTPGHRVQLEYAFPARMTWRTDALRRRLQPRAVARGALARGRRADARGGRHHGEPRHLLVGAHPASRGRVRLRMARPRHRPAARGRHRRRPRHGHGLAAPVGERRVSRAPPAGRGRGRLLAGQSPAVRAVVARLPPARGRARDGDRRAVCAASGRRHVARQQRVRLPPEHGLLGCRARCVPALAGRSLRHGRRAQRRLGHELLVAALPVVRRGVPAAQGALQPEPGPDARLPPVHERHAARVLPDGARPPPRRRGDATDHDELHGSPSSRRTTRSGPSTSTS